MSAAPEAQWPQIHVVDDDPAVLDALRMLLEANGYRVAVHGDAESFVRGGLVQVAAAPACIVSDVRMPGMSGIDLLRVLRDRRLNVPLIVITGHADVAMAVLALKQGAADFIEKPFEDSALLEAVAKAMVLAARNWDGRRQTSTIASCAASLTPREHEVMVFIAQGLSNKAVAAQLGISVRTVEIHRARVMEKMNADSLSALVRMVLALEEAGLLAAGQSESG